MVTILTTCPDYGSRNVGDRLIEMRLKSILAQEKGETEFVTIFREEPLEPHLEVINASRALLMPGFPIRDTPMYPRTYRLTEDLGRIEVPMIPIGANWNVYPGDAVSRRDVQYSQATTDFLRYVARQTQEVSCREPFVCEILRKHGVENVLLTGDPAMFSLDHLQTPPHCPSRVCRLVFSPPLSPFYADQADLMMTMLAETFPAAERICAFHLADAAAQTEKQRENSAAMTPEVAAKNRRIRARAKALGFELLDLAGHFEGLAAYESCDLHVGYECHAHLYFLSVRRPSVLIAEDARGVGFNHYFGVGGFDGFVRQSAAGNAVRKTHTSGYCTSREEFEEAPANGELHHHIRDFLKQQEASAFEAFEPIGPWLDDLYGDVMAPFIQSLP